MGLDISIILKANWNKSYLWEYAREKNIAIEEVGDILLDSTAMSVVAGVDVYKVATVIDKALLFIDQHAGYLTYEMLGWFLDIKADKMPASKAAMSRRFGDLWGLNQIIPEYDIWLTKEHLVDQKEQPGLSHVSQIFYL
jgi:hypothetical protein